MIDVPAAVPEPATVVALTPIPLQYKAVPTESDAKVQRVREILDVWTGPYSSKPALGQAAKELVQALRGVVG